MLNKNWFPDSIWWKINQEKMEKYGTTDYEEIERIEKYAVKKVAVEVDSQVEAEIENRLPKIQQKAHENAIKQVKADDLLEKGEIISNLSPFISDTITINGKELDKSMFIPERPINDPISEDVRLYFDDLNFRWLVNVKEGKPKLVSRFVVEACIIVDASGPGSCRAFVVFLKGRTKPLIFFNGNIESAMLRKQTHFQQRGLSTRNKDYYHESFIRSLCMCQKVCFLTLPKHAGCENTIEI